MDIISPLLPSLPLSLALNWEGFGSLLEEGWASLEPQGAMEDGEEGGYSWREDIHKQNPLLNLSTHPTPLRRIGGPYKGKGFVVSQSILAYEFDALLCNKKCEVEPLIESLNPLFLPISWEG